MSAYDDLAGRGPQDNNSGIPASGSRDSERRECECCGDDQLLLAEVDGQQLCVNCQPCPRCGRFGSDCDDDHDRCEPPSPLPAEGETEWPTLLVAGCSECMGLGAHASWCQLGMLTDPPASAAAGEVRVEWGVRYPDHVYFLGHYEGAGNDAQSIATSSDGAGIPVSRTVTTSPWVPVSDDQPKEQDR